MNLFTPNVFIDTLSSSIADFEKYSNLIIRAGNDESSYNWEEFILRGSGKQSQKEKFQKLNDAINEIFKKEGK